MRGYSPCGKRYAAMLFRGLCLGQTGHAGDRFYCAALAQKVDALKTFQYAALFGRRGASAFETAVLGHKYSPSYKINIKSVIKRRLFQIATFFLPLTNLFYSPKKSTASIFFRLFRLQQSCKVRFLARIIKNRRALPNTGTNLALSLRYRVRILSIFYRALLRRRFAYFIITFRIFIHFFANIPSARVATSLRAHTYAPF